jgi:hypothetical protein
MNIVFYGIIAVGLVGILGVFHAILTAAAVDEENLIAMAGVSFLMVFLGSIKFWA